jgi:hypothetical protein
VGLRTVTTIQKASPVRLRHTHRTDAAIVDVDFDEDCQPYALYVVEVRVSGRAPFRTEVGSPLFGRYHYPTSGSVPVVVDDKRQTVKLDRARLSSDRRLRFIRRARVL